tara:strand:+ start:16043 stop:16618 length:576 start_codon:yes stop_codon:yes gene_type:complete
MTNAELIGLAKNRFIDEEDQIAIAQLSYRRAHNYLIENTGLKKGARDLLWNYKGYARKCELINNGHYFNEPEKYHELYDGYATQIRSRSPWRIPRVFLAHYRWHSHGATSHTAQTGTPPEIIEDIYHKDVTNRRALDAHGPSGYYYSGPSNTERMIIENSNTPLDLIIKISAASPDERNRNLAMKTMAKRS